MSASARSPRAADLPTVGRLVVGLLRRTRWNFLMWVWMVALLMGTLADKGPSVRWVLAASMGLAFLLCLQTVEGAGRREHRVLPVTDRDIWITRWLSATCVVPSFLFATKCLGLVWIWVAGYGSGSFMTPETLLLSTLFDFVYAGASMPAPLLLESAATVLARWLSRSAFFVSLALMPVLFLLCIGGPLLFARTLPTHIADFSTANTVVLLLGMAMSVGAVVWTPRRGGDSLTFWSKSTNAASSPVAQRKADDSVTGVFGVLRAHVITTLKVSVLGLAMVFGAAPLLPEPVGADYRFASGMFLIFTFMGVGMSSVWTPWARRLKVLPLSVNQVNSLFTLTPLLTWLEVWLLLIVAQTLAGRPIYEELGPLAVFMYAGFSALTHACELRVRGNAAGQSIASVAWLVAAVAIGMALFGKPDLWARILVLVTGILSLAAAALLNHYTLTRSTSSARIYRTLGIPRP